MTSTENSSTVSDAPTPSSRSPAWRTRWATKRVISGALALSAVSAILWFAVLRPRPTALAMTARAGDDTVVINQRLPTRLAGSVIDQYGRRLKADTAVVYQRMSGDSIALASNGAVHCDKRGDAVVVATFERMSREFVLRCRPVAGVEMATWVDLVVGDSARDLAFIARDLDGRPVTELRGTVTVADPSVAVVEGTKIRARRAGQTVVIVDVGDEQAHVPVLVYDVVGSFVGNPRQSSLMAMHVSLGRGDTIVTPVPKAAFWVTYFSQDRAAAPPTIELRGDGLCTLGNGLTARRITDGEYAKYCYSANGTRMMIAHGANGADRVNGVVALRLVW